MNMMTPEQRIAAEPEHEAHGGDESPDREGCVICIEAIEFFLRHGEYPVFDIPPPPKPLAVTRMVSLGHCTSDLGRHHPLCHRDGKFCSMNSFHSGPCSPHGRRSLGDQARDRQVELGLGPDLFADWTEAEKRETFGR